jgi:hypothetical protein
MFHGNKAGQRFHEIFAVNDESLNEATSRRWSGKKIVKWLPLPNKWIQNLSDCECQLLIDEIIH